MKQEKQLLYQARNLHLCHSAKNSKELNLLHAGFQMHYTFQYTLKHVRNRAPMNALCPPLLWQGKIFISCFGHAWQTIAINQNTWITRNPRKTCSMPTSKQTFQVLQLQLIIHCQKYYIPLSHCNNLSHLSLINYVSTPYSLLSPRDFYLLLLVQLSR